MTWPTVPLGEVGDWFGGATPSKANKSFWTDGSIPWLSPKDMGPELVSDTEDHITSEAVAGSSVKLVPAGSVAVVVRSGIIERKIPVALVPFETTLNQDMKAVATRPDIDPRWVAWGLRACERELLRSTRKAGTTVASIEWPRFLSFEIPVPPFDEQHRIVELLEDHLSRLGAAESYLDAARRRIRAWQASLLDASIWSQGAPTRAVSDLLRETMRNGRSDRAVRGDAEGTRTLTLTAVTKGEFIDKFTKLTTTSPEVAKGLWLEPGDVFVQRSNTPELVGTVARYDGPNDWAIFPDLLIRLRADEDVVDSRYLAAALRSERTHRSLRAKAKPRSVDRAVGC